jgi:hypothetical protein
MNRIEARSRLAHIEGIVQGALARLMSAEAAEYFAALGPDGSRPVESIKALREAMLRAPVAVDLADLEVSAFATCRQLQAAPGPPDVIAELAAALERWLGLLFDPALRSAVPPEQMSVGLQEVVGRVQLACAALRAAVDSAGEPR